jgi:hypothetical protein
MKNVELKELVGGALQEQFGKSFEKIVENLQNPNTPYKNSREITIKLKFTQNEKRDDVKCAVQVSEKLAPQAPMETSFAIGKDLKTGELYAEEYGKQIKGQMSIDDYPAEQPQVIDGKKVDTQTGEIVSEQHSKVVDLRKAL